MLRHVLLLCCLSVPANAGPDIWDAVGRLDTGHDRFCTAVLVAPDRVLTAAHCLFDAENGAPLAVERLSFLTQWRNGEAGIGRGVRRTAANPDYVWAARPGTSRVAADLALVELNRPVRLEEVRPRGIASRGMATAEVLAVTFMEGSAESGPQLQACEVLERAQGVAALDCAVGSGASGAPVLVWEGGVFRVAAVISSMADLGGIGVALAAEILSTLPLLEARLKQAD